MFFRYLLAVAISLLTGELFAQTHVAQAVAHYVDGHNARVASHDWVKTESGAVVVDVVGQDLEVRLDDRLRIVLQRDGTDEMDHLFPRRVTAATVLLTNTAVIILDQDRELHLALSLLPEPQLPEVAGDPLLVFTGYGLGRHRTAEAE